MAKSITASVGLHGKNFKEDTLVVQQLLNGVSESQGGPKPKLEEDGKCGPLTKGAIQRFQLFHFGWHGADSRVDPDGPTLRKLNELNPEIVPPPPPVPPRPEPLSTDFFIWLRFKQRFFSQPLNQNEFLFTVIDVTNNRDANYILSFGAHEDIPPFPATGSGGHMKRIKARKPSTASGLVGDAVYTTRVTPGEGNALNRLSSSFSFFPEDWRVGAGITGITCDYDCHLFKPKPNEFGTTISRTGRFELL